MPNIPKTNAAKYIKAMGGNPLPMEQLSDESMPLIMRYNDTRYRGLFWRFESSPSEIKPLWCNNQPKTKSLNQIVKESREG